MLRVAERGRNHVLTLKKGLWYSGGFFAAIIN